MIKTNFIIGYLGAGKTTFIQSYLNSPVGRSEKILLIVNDFGQVNYDALSLDKNNVEINDITYGCLCCDLKIRFKEILLACGKRHYLDRILIEPSGILIPDIITELFEDPSISKNLHLEPLIQMVDVKLFLKIKDKNIPPFIVWQIAMSEKIVLNRAETISGAELMEVKKALHEINSHAVYYNFSNKKNANKILLSSTDKIESLNNSYDTAVVSSHKYKNVQVDSDLEFENKKELIKYLNTQGPNLERAKGIVSVGRIPLLMNYTRSGLSLSNWVKPFDLGVSMIFSKN